MRISSQISSLSSEERWDTTDWLPQYAHVIDPSLSNAFVLNENQDSPYGRCLGATGINVVLNRLQNALLKKGYTTSRVLAMPQDISTGTLKVQLIVGMINKIKYTSNAKSTFGETAQSPSLLTALPMAEGDILNLRDIEMALENFKRVPTADADIKIEPAKSATNPGLSDLNITQQQSTPYRASIGFNDAGFTGTGKYGGSATLSLDQLFWVNDLFYLAYNQDVFNEALKGKEPLPRSNYGYVVHYSIPLGYWGYEATHSRNAYYQTVVGATRNYVYSGFSYNTEAKVSAMVHRDALAKTSLSFKLWQKKSSNFVDDAEVEVQRRITAGFDLGLHFRTLLNQQTQSSFETNWIYREGIDAFGAMRAPEESFDEGTARPRLLLADATLTQPLQVDAQRFKYLAQARLQINLTKLLPSDRFAIGGRYTVRGFDTGLAAERGIVFRQDLGWAVPTTQSELYLGLDYGYVEGESAVLLAGQSLAGMALGWRGKWAQNSKLVFDVFWAQPLHKPSTFKAATQTAGISLTYNF